MSTTDFIPRQLIRRALVTWRYVAAAHPTVKHALLKADDPEAICGTVQIPSSNWHGTGYQVEYDTVARLPECQRCSRMLTPPEESA